MSRELDPTLPRCSQQSRWLREDPVGSAPHWTSCLVLELPQPWEPQVELSRAFPKELRQALAELARRGEPVRLQCVLPDPDYSTDGMTRMIHLARPANPLDACQRTEYLVPTGMSAEVAITLLGSGEVPERVRQWLQPAGPHRDILVCTHGKRDTCCGSFGVPIYEKLRSLARAYSPGGPDPVRVWRTSHTGGHRFAPTLIDLPEGRYWAFVDGQMASDILHRSGDLRLMTDRYRGWAALSSPAAQSAEKVALARVGWDWIAARKRIASHTTSGEPERHTIRFTHGAADGGPQGEIEVSLEQAGEIPTMNCMKQGSKGNNPQYRVLSE